MKTGFVWVIEETQRLNNIYYRFIATLSVGWEECPATSGYWTATVWMCLIPYHSMYTVPFDSIIWYYVGNFKSARWVCRELKPPILFKKERIWFLSSNYFNVISEDRHQKEPFPSEWCRAALLLWCSASSVSPSCSLYFFVCVDIAFTPLLQACEWHVKVVLRGLSFNASIYSSENSFVTGDSVTINRRSLTSWA